MLREIAGRSPVRAVSDGRRAAISIDRYLQKVSQTASRVNEGSYVTRLYTATAGIPALPATPMSDPAAGYTRTEAVAEAPAVHPVRVYGVRQNLRVPAVIRPLPA